MFRKVGKFLFINERLIVSYIQEPDQNRYFFQLAGGDVHLTTREEFAAHWEEYRQFEAERAAQNQEHYRPLPITLEIRHTLKTRPVNIALRRRRQSA